MRFKASRFTPHRVRLHFRQVLANHPRHTYPLASSIYRLDMHSLVTKHMHAHASYVFIGVVVVYINIQVHEYGNGMS